MKKFSPILILLAIIIGATVLRLYRLGSVPLSPYWEETALGYDAFSIARTGKDFHGNPYPLLAFPSFGDYKPSGYFYALVPFIKVFGLSTATVRLPSVLAGVISVALIYFIGKRLLDERVGLLAAALLAISPWAIQFSRGGWEVNLALMLILAGVHCLLGARKNFWMLTFAVLFFGLSMYTYHAARLFAPLIGGLGGIAVLALWWRETKRPQRQDFILPLVVALSLALALVLPFAVNFGNQVVSSRFTQTTVLNDLEPAIKSNAQIQNHGGTVIARMVYHRYWYYAGAIFQGGLKHLSPEFLFVRGDGNLRHWSGRYGLLYPLDLVFLMVTLGVLILGRKRKDLRATRIVILILVVWILLAAVPPALVKPTPHALRFLFAAPAFVLMSAIGISVLARGIPRRGVVIFTLAVSFAYAYLFGSFFYWYMNIYPSRSAGDWQYGYAQVFRLLEREKKVGERVYMTRDQGRPSMFYLFFSQYDPAKIQVSGPQLPKDQLELLQIDDYYFVDTVSSDPGLYATPENKVDPKAKVLDTIRRPDGSVVWVVWRR